MVEVDDIVIDLEDEESEVNLPSPNPVFDHKAWQDSILRAEAKKTALNESVTADMQDSWSREGVQALERGAIKDPLGYVRVIQNQLPKTMDVNVSNTLTPTGVAVDSARTMVLQEMLTKHLGNHKVKGRIGYEEPEDAEVVSE